MVWGHTCGKTGNCWLYEGRNVRYLLNFTAAGMSILCLLFWMCSDSLIFCNDLLLKHLLYGQFNLRRYIEVSLTRVNTSYVLQGRAMSTMISEISDCECIIIFALSIVLKKTKIQKVCVKSCLNDGTMMEWWTIPRTHSWSLKFWGERMNNYFSI